MNVEVKASKEGFSTNKLEVLAIADRVREVPTIRLEQTVGHTDVVLDDTEFVGG